MKIRIKVKPNAKKEEIKKIEDDYFEIRVTVVPEKGKANKKVIEILSKYFKVPKSNITLLKGETSKEKLFEIIPKD
ncbi:DUF167 domain-containing protein [Hydrogenothermus marinus]|uniref:UPF0235 protein CLV39_0232 n=1 Tax=Hydrogenothermus marinus TaxID=133270 RepID=A0A3M0C3S2_9AQUI|nr:DUF167 domain-containing protein [Hydrogenothermus marinus]RMA97612.1 hypothetical protein CLV39_0232 [Hydrogenothermus marinus]